ncbi:MAG: MraY family glycosyltransferase [Candidatus Omnitrophica bacterium]|nr:MraY family glycosyltransferase [Candidatus Omnitrophota bacterium]
MLISFAGIAEAGFLLSVLFLLLIKEASYRWKFLTSKGVPSIGGISMGAAFFACFLWIGPSVAGFPREIKGILIASSVMLVAGIFDDRRELSVAQKFAVQLVAAFILIGFGVKTDLVYGGHLLNVVISLLWIIGITNAVNLLDVMDGLAGGTSILILSGFCIISAMNGDVLTLTLSCVLGGTVLGFWLYNVPPAKVYMGNSGSHFLGLVLAAIGLTARYATLERPVALLAPVLLLGFPILDTLFLILMRIKKRKSAFNKSEDHMALRFLKKGYSKQKTLALMMGWTLFFVMGGVVLSKVPNLFAILTLVLTGLGSLILIKKMSRVQI